MIYNIHLIHYGLIKILELIYSYETYRNIPLRYWLDYANNLFINKDNNIQSGGHFINTKNNAYVVAFP